MSWNCEQIELRLSDYVDRLLSPAERQAFLAHAEGCAQCRPLVAQVGGMVRELHRLEPLDVPLRLVNRILEQTTAARRARSRWPAWRRWMQPVWQPRFAMGLATVTLVFFFVFQAMGVRPAELTWQDLSPVSLYRAADRQVHLFYARSVKFVNDLRVVYEIQTRLRPDPVPESEPPPAEAPQEAPAKPFGSAQDKPAPGKQRNRADEITASSAILALAVTDSPGRVWR